MKLTDKNDYHLQKNDDDNNDDPPMRTMDISLYLSIYIYVYINIYILFSLSEPHIDNFLDIFFRLGSIWTTVFPYEARKRGQVQPGAF